MGMPVYRTRIIYKSSDMSYSYSKDLLDVALSYADYRSGINELLSAPPAGEQEEKMRPYISNNVQMMDGFDSSYVVSDQLRQALHDASPSIWFVLTEGWCGDAAYCVPLFAAIEREVPGKVTLCLLYRDQHPALMDAYLTDGARSIPKLICLDMELRELVTWGPRPAALHNLVSQWKSEGMQLKQLISKVNDWYLLDDTRSTQEELAAMIRAYSKEY
jgi:hypothetical protein